VSEFPRMHLLLGTWVTKGCEAEYSAVTSALALRKFVIGVATNGGSRERWRKRNMSEENKVVARRVYEVIATGNLDLAEEIVDPRPHLITNAHL
jgi:hypothetical protein